MFLRKRGQPSHYCCWGYLSISQELRTPNFVWDYFFYNFSKVSHMKVMIEWLQFLQFRNCDKHCNIMKDCGIRIWKISILTPKWGQNLPFLWVFCYSKAVWWSKLIETLVVTTLWYSWSHFTEILKKWPLPWNRGRSS